MTTILILLAPVATAAIAFAAGYHYGYHRGRREW